MTNRLKEIDSCTSFVKYVTVGIMVRSQSKHLFSRAVSWNLRSAIQNLVKKTSLYDYCLSSGKDNRHIQIYFFEESGIRDLFRNIFRNKQLKIEGDILLQLVENDDLVENRYLTDFEESSVKIQNFPGRWFDLNIEKFGCNSPSSQYHTEIKVGNAFIEYLQATFGKIISWEILKSRSGYDSESLAIGVDIYIKFESSESALKMLEMYGKRDTLIQRRKPDGTFTSYLFTVSPDVDEFMSSKHITKRQRKFQQYLKCIKRYNKQEQKLLDATLQSSKNLEESLSVLSEDIRCDEDIRLYIKELQEFIESCQQLREAASTWKLLNITNEMDILDINSDLLDKITMKTDKMKSSRHSLTDYLDRFQELIHEKNQRHDNEKALQQEYQHTEEVIQSYIKYQQLVRDTKDECESLRSVCKSYNFPEPVVHHILSRTESMVQTSTSIFSRYHDIEGIRSSKSTLNRLETALSQLKRSFEDQLAITIPMIETSKFYALQGYALAKAKTDIDQLERVQQKSHRKSRGYGEGFLERSGETDGGVIDVSDGPQHTSPFLPLPQLLLPTTQRFFTTIQNLISLGNGKVSSFVEAVLATEDSQGLSSLIPPAELSHLLNGVSSSALRLIEILQILLETSETVTPLCNGDYKRLLSYVVPPVVEDNLSVQKQHQQLMELIRGMVDRFQIHNKNLNELLSTVPFPIDIHVSPPPPADTTIDLSVALFFDVSKCTFEDMLSIAKDLHSSLQIVLEASEQFFMGIEDAATSHVRKMEWLEARLEKQREIERVQEEVNCMVKEERRTRLLQRIGVLFSERERALKAKAREGEEGRSSRASARHVDSAHCDGSDVITSGSSHGKRKRAAERKQTGYMEDRFQPDASSGTDGDVEEDGMVLVRPVWKRVQASSPECSDSEESTLCARGEIRSVVRMKSVAVLVGPVVTAASNVTEQGEYDVADESTVASFDRQQRELNLRNYLLSRKMK